MLPLFFRVELRFDSAMRNREHSVNQIREPRKFARLILGGIGRVNGGTLHRLERSAVVCKSQIVIPRRAMKVCYCDESGTGDEPIAVMVGILVDSQRMHITKQEWCDLLEVLSTMAGRKIAELHTRHFYAGNSVFREIDGPTRARLITRIFEWIGDRKHHVVFTSVCRDTYYKNYALQYIPDELNTLWRFMGFHLMLAVQKWAQREPKNKGNTIFIFDNKEREQLRFTDVILRPPSWSGEYYGLAKNQKPLDQVIDVPYFGDSEDVGLIQLADFVAFFLRRYAEIKENLVPEKYAGEANKMEGWIEMIVERSIGTSYKKIGRNNAEEQFFQNASKSIRML